MLAGGAAAADLVIWAAVFTAVLLGAVVFLGWYRGWVRRSMNATSGRFTLDDFRRLRDRGDLTASEYERLRAAAIADLDAEPSRDP